MKTFISRFPCVPLFASPPLSHWVPGEFLSFSSKLCAVSPQARLSTPGTGASYTRTDIVAWSLLAFPAKTKHNCQWLNLKQGFFVETLTVTNLDKLAFWPLFLNGGFRVV